MHGGSVREGSVVPQDDTESGQWGRGGSQENDVGSWASRARPRLIRHRRTLDVNGLVKGTVRTLVGKPA